VGRFEVRIGKKGEPLEVLTVSSLFAITTLLLLFAPDTATIREGGQRLFRKSQGGMRDEIAKWTALKLRQGASEVILDLWNREDESIASALEHWR